MGQVFAYIDLPDFIGDRESRQESIDIVADHLLNGHIVSDALDEIRYNREDVLEQLKNINPATVTSLICLPALGQDVSNMKPTIMKAAKDIAAEIVDSYIHQAEKTEEDFYDFDGIPMLQRQAS